MKVVILCGGKGTRIRGVDDTVPKPMIPVGAQPIVVHIMEHYAFYGHRDFVLCLGYLGSVIREFFGTSPSGKTETVSFALPRAGKANVTLVDTGLDAMTGARVRKIRDVYLLDIFVREQPQPFRVDGSTVNYRSFLGSQVSHSSSLNFRRFTIGTIAVDRTSVATNDCDPSPDSARVQAAKPAIFPAPSTSGSCRTRPFANKIGRAHV